MIKNILKSILAVIAGFVGLAVLSVAADLLFQTLGVFPQQELFDAWMLGIALFYRSIFAVFGGYVTARLAPRNPMRHVYVLLTLVFVGSIPGVIFGWSYGNQWYPVALAITGPCFVFLGGKLYRDQNLCGLV